jgi:hypothetical protein
MEKRSVVRAEFSAAADEKLPSRAKWRILKFAGESVPQKSLDTAEVVIDGLNYAAPTALDFRPSSLVHWQMPSLVHTPS